MALLGALLDELEDSKSRDTWWYETQCDNMEHLFQFTCKLFRFEGSGTTSVARANVTRHGDEQTILQCHMTQKLQLKGEKQRAQGGTRKFKIEMTWGTLT